MAGSWTAPRALSMPRGLGQSPPSGQPRFPGRAAVPGLASSSPTTAEAPGALLSGDPRARSRSVPEWLPAS
ncbi:hypothetical protein E2562_003833 [Oryza meyeriana var. granulata]|uniref:Uncharacterized protein n=1 Tax=Oryza meyeriana var. granulata TaxID=110450 RepID=A0A6G1CYH9_9ORYZ|nr:hypothetical protein E2562_003833 [Oryza meyeriana var. granulata]